MLLRQMTVPPYNHRYIIFPIQTSSFKSRPAQLKAVLSKVRAYNTVKFAGDPSYLFRIKPFWFLRLQFCVENGIPLNRQGLFLLYGHVDRIFLQWVANLLRAMVVANKEAEALTRR